jgi:glycerol-3-phosphate acyltransferase PlsY
VLVLDGFKGWAAAWIAGRTTQGSDYSFAWMTAAALAAMIGHAYPIALQFKGGKSVATFFGAFLAISPVTAAAAAVLYLGGMLVTRHSSVGSLLAVTSSPLGIWLIEHPGKLAVALAIVAAMLVVVRHKENIRRIREGTEPRLF